MPDTVIRDELLESDRWLDLPCDTDRLAYIILRLKADNFGNLEAGPRRIYRMLANATQVKTEEGCAVILSHLSDADLVRHYAVADREFLHLPRSRPTGSYLVRKCPPSPWCDPEIKLGKHIRMVSNQGLAKNIPITSQERNKDVSLGIGIGIGIGKGKKHYAPSDAGAQFAELWLVYPKRDGGNSKAGAFAAYKARLKQGHTHETMLAGVNRYAAWLEAHNRVGTVYVKTAETFLGPKLHFLETFAQPVQTKGVAI